MQNNPDEGLSRRLPLEELAQRCAEETQKFRRHVPYVSAYCFELFRRALVLHNEHAWSRIYTQYESLVRTWASRHRAASELNDEFDDIINEAFTRLHRAVSAEKFEYSFHELPALLAFLKRCTISAMLDALRVRNRQPKEEAESLLEGIRDFRPSVPDSQGEELWRWLESQLQNEHERTVIYASFVYELTPAQILQEYAHLFTQASEIYTIKRNILARLKRHANTTHLQA